MKARSQWKTQAACNTTKHTWTEARAAERNSRPHTPTKRQNVEYKCPNPDMKPKLKTWVPGSEHHAPTWNPDMMVVSGLCHKTMNNTRPKWQNPDSHWI